MDNIMLSNDRLWTMNKYNLVLFVTNYNIHVLMYALMILRHGMVHSKFNTNM